MVQFRLVVIISLGMTVLLQPAHADVNDLQLKREILAGWAELERIDNALLAIDGTWTSVETGGTTEKKRVGKGRFRRFGELMKVAGEIEQGRVEDIVINSKYLFFVIRDSTTDPWRLRYASSDLSGANEVKEKWFSHKVVAPSAVVILGSPITQQLKPSSLANDPHFKITKVDRLPDGMVALHYTHAFVEGELICDPSLNYLIRRGQSFSKDQARERRMTFERQLGPADADGRVHVVHLSSTVTDTPGTKRSYERTYSYPDVSKTDELDPEQYRLTHYGLPEPEGVVWEKPRRWLPYWIAGIGAVIIILTTLIIRYRRRSPLPEKPL